MSLVITGVIVLFLIYQFSRSLATSYTGGDLAGFVEGLAFAAAVSFLIYGNLLYQWCRLSNYQRASDYRAASPLIHGGDDTATLGILVPSYKEEPRVVLQTLLSAALTEYPNKTIVLLLDDPPNAASGSDAERTAATKGMVAELHQRFQAAAGQYHAQLAEFIQRPQTTVADEVPQLAAHYLGAADRIESICSLLSASEPPVPSHTDVFFDKEIAERAAESYRAKATQILDAAGRGEITDRGFFERHYERLTSLFAVDFLVFERKRFVNLSHESNKAMNLNSFIGLMGHNWQIVESAAGRHLRQCDSSQADLRVPAFDYLITLDADSMLLHEYATTLIRQMEQPSWSRVAIAQTPYSAFRGAPGGLEQIAGATTDLQYLVHQGFTGGNATFWVGANALIRRRALDDIKETRLERGHPVQVFIQDKTLIEDTESSIDLIRAGWTLHNHPARLAYSATPPDFGSLLIQRHRWANGGLLILGKLFAYAWHAPKNASLLREFSLRFHYLASLAGGSAATLLLFFYPFSDRFNSVLIPLSALPYFVLYARDLGLAGYRYSDVVRVYALNIALLPVIVGGVIRSLYQGITGAKLPFGRTPKVATRSAAPPLYAAIELVLPFVFLVGCVFDAMAHRWSHAAFGLINGALFLYALTALLGFRNTVFDATARLRRPVADPAPALPASIGAHAARALEAPALQAEGSVLIGE